MNEYQQIKKELGELDYTIQELDEVLEDLPALLIAKRITPKQLVELAEIIYVKQSAS